MTTRTKVTLAPEQETLLITLYAKAQPHNPLFYDPTARDILDRVDYDFAGLHVPYKTVILVCQRAKKLDAVTREFLAEHPGGVVVQLGCGLDARCRRVDDGRVIWYDLDMPPVMELRRRFFPESERYHLIAASATDLAWMDTVAAGGQPVLVVAEGLLMYLDEDHVQGSGCRGCLGKMPVPGLAVRAAQHPIGAPARSVCAANLGMVEMLASCVVSPTISSSCDHIPGRQTK